MYHFLMHLIKILKIGHWNASLILKLPIFGELKLVIKKATAILLKIVNIIL